MLYCTGKRLDRAFFRPVNPVAGLAYSHARNPPMQAFGHGAAPGQRG